MIRSLRARFSRERFARLASARSARVSTSSVGALGAASALLFALQALPARAGTLEIYEASVGQGQVRTIPGPVTNALVDLDYAPITAEGGKLYGMSEIEIEATGNLVLSPTGFACQASGCLFSPSPFVAGKKLRVTAGNDLAGETSAAANLLTIGVTGSAGHIVLVRGEYLDGTATGAKVGSIRALDAGPLVTVPEPDPTRGLAAALLLLGLLAPLEAKRALRRAPASARSGFAPWRRAPRAR